MPLWVGVRGKCGHACRWPGPGCQLWAPSRGLLWSLLFSLPCRFFACWLFGTKGQPAMGRRRGCWLLFWGTLGYMLLRGLSLSPAGDVRTGCRHRPSPVLTLGARSDGEHVHTVAPSLQLLLRLLPLPQPFALERSQKGATLKSMPGEARPLPDTASLPDTLLISSQHPHTAAEAHTVHTAHIKRAAHAHAQHTHTHGPLYADAANTSHIHDTNCTTSTTIHINMQTH